MAESAGSATEAVARSSSRVERRRDRRKAEIVATATELLSARGYQGMSLEDVAEQSDIRGQTERVSAISTTAESVVMGYQ